MPNNEREWLCLLYFSPACMLSVLFFSMDESPEMNIPQIELLINTIFQFLL